MSFDATIVFLKQHDNHINLLVQFTKHRQLTRQVGDSRALLFVEKEAIAPRTIGGLAHGMARGGRICHENHGSISVEGPAPTSAFSHGPDLHPGDQDSIAYGGHTLRTAFSGSILEFTYIGGQYPPSPPAMAKTSTQEAKYPWLDAS